MPVTYCDKCDRHIDLDYDSDHDAESHPSEAMILLDLSRFDADSVTVRVLNSDGEHVGDIIVSDWYMRRGDVGMTAIVEAPEGGVRFSDELGLVEVTARRGTA